MKMIRKTAHQYNKQNFQGTFGQVKEQNFVEASWLGSSEPFINAAVTCYITEMMEASVAPKWTNRKLIRFVHFHFRYNPYPDCILAQQLYRTGRFDNGIRQKRVFGVQ
jgi:hypothetical protein